eukprot:2650100-Alexandrium_andersonii.AAC.1
MPRGSRPRRAPAVQSSHPHKPKAPCSNNRGADAASRQGSEQLHAGGTAWPKFVDRPQAQPEEAT